MARTPAIDSAGRVLDVLLELLRADFVAGVAPTELARALDYGPSAITRYIATLTDRGLVERIPETGRLRPSVRMGQYAASILRSLDDAQRRAAELARRISQPTT